MRLTVAAALLMSAGCAGDARTEARLTGYGVTARTTLVIEVDGCHLDPQVTQLEQTSSQVRVTVHRDAASPLGQSSCADVVTVELDAPLGRRAVVNASTGVPVQRRGG